MRNMQHYDLAIIGLGPAGATLARMLAPHFSVLALDRKAATGDHGFSKPCGGLLAPDAQKALAGFGLTLPLQVLVDPQIFAVRTIDLQSRRVRHYQRFYLNMDRLAFDRWLISLIPDSADIRLRAKCRTVERLADGYKLTWTEDGEERQATADLLAGADGAASLVRRFLYPALRTRHYLAVQQWFAVKNPEPLYTSLFDPELTDCYCWGLTKGDSLILGGAFDPHDAMRKMRLLRSRVEGLGNGLDMVLGEARRTEACKVFRPRRPADFRTGRDNAFLIGEAAGLISPSSLEGISYALHSAKCLAEVLKTSRRKADSRYKSSIAGIKAKLLLKTGKAAVIYTPFTRRLAMASGLDSIEVEE